jgi:hypothetical protein
MGFFWIGPLRAKFQQRFSNGNRLFKWNLQNNAKSTLIKIKKWTYLISGDQPPRKHEYFLHEWDLSNGPRVHSVLTINHILEILD